jgi:uncharacterized protein YbgA (DUF1722 family)/uncharacterized protein YbbK (DUF523 family)
LIRMGISACLLGQSVRYDGGHSLDPFLRDGLGRFVEWVPVCPETECGLGVPREAMHLVDGGGPPRLVTRETGADHTDRLLAWAGKKVAALARAGLCGFVFKSKSPSSGLSGVKVYPADGSLPKKNGTGLFTAEFMKAFPLVPVEDDSRLNDPELRENFIERIFVYGRWMEVMEANPTPAAWTAFHAAHKLLIMAHSPAAATGLGRLAAEAGDVGIREKSLVYLSGLMAALRIPATVKKNVNVLQHIMGYFKKNLTPNEKRECLEVIGNYGRGLVPLAVPVTLLGRHVRRFDQPYLKSQWYLHPAPAELMPRNHV